MFVFAKPNQKFTSQTTEILPNFNSSLVFSEDCIALSVFDGIFPGANSVEIR